MSQNAKNQLQELLQSLGHPADQVQFRARGGGDQHEAWVEVGLSDRVHITAHGQASRRTEAEIKAAEDALVQLRAQHPELWLDWTQIYAEAQAGDALIKLAAYLSDDLPTPEDKSRYLQAVEADAHFVRVFDHWRSQGDPDLVLLGPNLGKKNKATYVEALIWRRYGQQVLGPGSSDHLQALLATLQL